MAHVVGAAGRVTALELDQELASRATENLSELKWVQVVAADASLYRIDPADAILVNAGTTHPVPTWLNSLRPGGKLLVPLTTTGGKGAVLKVTRCEESFAARFIKWIQIFNCAGARDAEEEKLLRKKFSAGDSKQVRALRMEPHEVATSCWFHTDNFCLSKREAAS